MEPMLLPKRSRRAEAEAQWRAEVSAQLALLMKAQTQVTKFASLQLEDRERQRPSWLAWAQAAFLLVISGSIAFTGIIGGALAPLQTANASSLFTKANNKIMQANQILQPIVIPENREGAATWFAHATKADLNNLTTAAKLAIASNNDEKEASADQASANRWQLAGPALLTLGSALGGAVVGWILTQWLGTLRWPKRKQPKSNLASTE